MIVIVLSILYLRKLLQFDLFLKYTRHLSRVLAHTGVEYLKFGVPFQLIASKT